MSLNLKYGRYGSDLYTWERGSNLLLRMEVGRTLTYSGFTAWLIGTVPVLVPVTLRTNSGKIFLCQTSVVIHFKLMQASVERAITVEYPAGHISSMQ